MLEHVLSDGEKPRAQAILISMKSEELDWDRAKPFILSVKVPSSSIDSYGHVNNAEYLKWLDDCARAHSLELGIDCDQAIDFGFGMAVRESQLQYIVAAHLDDELRVGTWIVENDERLRISREFQIMRVSDQRTLVRGQLNYVCINLASGRPVKMPAEFQQAYRITID